MSRWTKSGEADEGELSAADMIDIVRRHLGFHYQRVMFGATALSEAKTDELSTQLRAKKTAFDEKTADLGRQQR